MRYLSVDIETTGLNPETCDMIEFAAVLADTNNFTHDLPTFHTYISHPLFTGEPYALSMHAQIFRRIATETEGFTYLEPGIFGYALAAFLLEHNVVEKIPVAGKNFGSFDLQFLKKFTFGGVSVDTLFSHRFLDPAMLYFDPKNDSRIPDLSTCKTRAGLEGGVAHNALDDALDVVRVLSAKFKL